MLCLRYRWEFLRRNKEYQRDYARITVTLGVTDIIRNKYPEQLVHKVLEILSKWDLLNPIPPKLSFSALLKSDKKLRSFHMDSLLVSGFAIDIYDSPDSLSPEKLYINGSMVKLYVDMRYPKEKIGSFLIELKSSWV